MDAKIRTCLLLVAAVASPALAAQSHWVVTWGASPAPQLADDAQMRAAKLVFENQPFARSSTAASAAIPYVCGFPTPMERKPWKSAPPTLHCVTADPALSQAQIARSRSVAGRRSQSRRTRWFLSDPVKLNVPAAGDLAISIFIRKKATGAGVHYSAQQTSYIGQGDLTSAASFSAPATISSWCS